MNDPENYFAGKEPDVKRLFEEKLFELPGQPYMVKPAKTIASEIVNLHFNKLLNNDMNAEWLSIYHKWFDSNFYEGSLQNYIDHYQIGKGVNVWNVPPEHCFNAIDLIQLKQITANFRDVTFVKNKLEKIKGRTQSQRANRFVPAWWQDLITREVVLSFAGCLKKNVIQFEKLYRSLFIFK